MYNLSIGLGEVLAATFDNYLHKIYPINVKTGAGRESNGQRIWLHTMYFHPIIKVTEKDVPCDNECKRSLAICHKSNIFVNTEQSFSFFPFSIAQYYGETQSSDYINNHELSLVDKKNIFPQNLNEKILCNRTVVF